ncbi:MAG: hypothetical protein D9V47_13355 [Clostridia bacterium]|nr:MAG: hypothetical protein D9V47_13355 [Clostridia bacterium]
MDDVITHGSKERRVVMAREYDTFVDNPDGFEAGEIDVAVRELTPDDRRKKYLTRYVRAKVAPSEEELPGSDILWLRWQRGRVFPRPWRIQVIRELGEFMPKKAVVRNQ